MNLPELLQLKFPSIDYGPEGNVTLHDNGDGILYIGKWDLSDPKPTSEDIASWKNDTALQNEFIKNNVIETRKASYPSVQDQLDMLYHDMKDSTQNWINTISNIKALNPLPEPFVALDEAVVVEPVEEKEVSAAKLELDTKIEEVK